jgi:hypothetical protein
MTKFPSLLIDHSDSAAEQIWDDGYAPALSAALNLPRQDVEQLNLCHKAGSGIDVAHWQLDRVRNAPYLIADLTAPSRNTLVLVGYALANHKRTILMHSRRSGATARMGDVSSRPYDDVTALRNYIAHIVEYEDSRTVTRTEKLRDFFPRCGFPLLVLEGDGHYEYSLGRALYQLPIQVTVDMTEFEPPEPWRGEFAVALDRKKEQAAASHAVFFNGELVRVRDYTPERNEMTGFRGVRIDGQRTDYFTFVSSNHCWDVISVESAERLRALEDAHPSDLRDSVLANPLTVSISLVIRDGGKEWLIMQRRNRDKTSHGKQDFQCAAAGMVSLTRDISSGVVNVFSAACNELREETGIWVREDQVQFTALLRETKLREVGLVGEVALDGDMDSLLGPRADSFESSGFLACEATPEAFGEFLRANRPRERFTPLGAGAIFFSLLRRYSLERVDSELAL